MAAPNNIIIKKIKKGGHGHHGGAWKVAYADFVTAMMAFFLLMWLLASTPQEKLEGIADFFAPTVGLRDSKGIGTEGGQAPVPDGNKKSDSSDSALVFSTTTSGAIVKDPDKLVKAPEENDAKNFSNVEHDLYKAIEKNPELKEFKDNIIIEQTPEGLKIQLLDQQSKPMFPPGSSELQPHMKLILKKIAEVIRYLPNYISIAGHTSSNNVVGTKTIDSWQLSSDRANSTRHFLVSTNLIDYDQIARIVGKADREPLDTLHPDAPKNMRMELLLLRQTLIPFQKKSAPESDGTVKFKDKTLDDNAKKALVPQNVTPDTSKTANPEGKASEPAPEKH